MHFVAGSTICNGKDNTFDDSMKSQNKFSDKNYLSLSAIFVLRGLSNYFRRCRKYRTKLQLFIPKQQPFWKIAFIPYFCAAALNLILHAECFVFCASAFLRDSISRQSAETQSGGKCKSQSRPCALSCFHGDSESSMFLGLLAKGFLLGLIVSVPLGPVGALCIQRTIGKGYKSGLLGGLGAACADLLYALVAGFGVSVVIDALIKVRKWIQIGGAAIFMLMAYKVFNTNPAIQVRKNRHQKHRPLEDFILTFLLTFSNPTPVFVFMAAFAGFIVGDEGVNYHHIIISIAGVFAGCLAWWFTLVSCVNMFRHKIRLRHLLWVNKITGVVVFIFAVFLLIEAFQ